MDDESIRDNPPEDSKDDIPTDELEKIEFKKSRGYYRAAMDSQDLFGNLDQFERKLVRGVMRGSGPIIFKARENNLYEDFLEDVMCIKK
ncbi:MAG: hypothetical protein HY802_06990 [Methanobacterium sp.]|nr:hypothetical protein [Methanobacterium sp.]